MIVFGARIDRDGPLFDNRAALAAAGYADEIEQVIAEVGVNKVRVALAPFLKHPTGYYMSQLQASRAFDGWEIHDSDVVYGPWLAGVGSRNKTTRFKGYRHWQIAIQEIRRDADGIAEFVLDKYLPRMR
ncbi:MAG: hypothetical protein ACRDQ0_05700 [Pseudonocardia sp.]